MKVRRRSPLSNKLVELELPLSEEEFAVAELRWKRGTLIQEAFPSLNAEQREFIQTGISPEEWKAMFPEDTDNFGNQKS